MWLVCLKLLILIQQNAPIDLSYQEHTSVDGIKYFEGKKVLDRSGGYITLIGAKINETNIDTKDKFISVRFHLLEHGTPSFLNLLEIKENTNYRLSKVKTKWAPGKQHEFRWKSDVLMYLATDDRFFFNNLAGVVRIQNQEPLLNETIAPIYLSSIKDEKGGAAKKITVSNYSFYFKCNFLAEIQWQLFSGDKVLQHGNVSNPFSGKATPIRLDAKTLSPGNYLLQLEATDQESFESTIYSCRFYHAKKI